MLRLKEKPVVWSRLVAWRKWIFLLALATVFYTSRTVWLKEIGEFLVQAEVPQPAEIVVVLAGDGYGHRLMKAVELVRGGYAKQVLVDGPFAAYDANEAELAIQWALRQGVPKEVLVPLPMRARSTVMEANVVDAELRRREVRKALIVTSNFHTRRARAVFRNYGSKTIQYIVVAAPDEDFEPEDWWRNRNARKVVFMEYAKLVNWWLE